MCACECDGSCCWRRSAGVGIIWHTSISCMQEQASQLRFCTSWNENRVSKRKWCVTHTCGCVSVGGSRYVWRCSYQTAVCVLILCTYMTLLFKQLNWMHDCMIEYVHNTTCHNLLIKQCLAHFWCKIYTAFFHLNYFGRTLVMSLFGSIHFLLICPAGVMGYAVSSEWKIRTQQARWPYNFTSQSMKKKEEEKDGHAHDPMRSRRNMNNIIITTTIATYAF